MVTDMCWLGIILCHMDCFSWALAVWPELVFVANVTL